MKAVILAGGLGTRLRTTVPDRPKAMAAVGGRPFLRYQLEFLAKWNITDVVLCVGYLHEQIQKYFDDGSSFGVSLRYSVECKPLGTAGAIKHAQPLLDNTFLVLNGDTYLNLDLEQVLDRHAGGPQVATLTLLHARDGKRYGSVTTDSTGCVIAFAERGGLEPCLINGGLYVFEPGALEFIPPNREVSLERETFPLMVDRRLVMGCVMEGYYLDIGTPESYLTAQRELPGQLGP